MLRGGDTPDCSSCPIADIAPYEGAEELVNAFIKGKQLRVLNPHTDGVERSSWEPAGVMDDPNIFLALCLGWASYQNHLESKRKAKRASENYLRGKRRA